jgi:hypothetical protein
LQHCAICVTYDKKCHSICESQVKLYIINICFIGRAQRMDAENPEMSCKQHYKYSELGEDVSNTILSILIILSVDSCVFAVFLCASARAGSALDTMKKTCSGKSLSFLSHYCFHACIFQDVMMCSCTMVRCVVKFQRLE